MKLNNIGNSLTAWLSAALIIIAGILFILNLNSTAGIAYAQAEENKEEIKDVATIVTDNRISIAELTINVDNTTKNVDRLVDKIDKIMEER